MKFILAWMFRWPLVWTEDFDGEVRLRRVYSSPFGEQKVTGIAFTSGSLRADGSITNHNYMRHWKPANKRAHTLFIG